MPMDDEAAALADGTQMLDEQDEGMAELDQEEDIAGNNDNLDEDRRALN